MKPASENQEHLRGIQEVARELGVTMRTLRFYEDQGLVEPRRVGTTRIYDKRAMARMRAILRGKRLGFSIRDIKSYLDLYDVDPEHQEQSRALLAKVRERRALLERQKAALEQTLADLELLEQQTLAQLR